MSFFPLFLSISSRRKVVVIGGGAVALGKIEAMLPYAPTLYVVAESFCMPLQTLLTQHNITYTNASYRAEQLQGAVLVIAATDNAELNQIIYDDAKMVGALVNVVDNPEFCDVIFPAIVRRGEVQIAISTGGVSPVLARIIKQKIEQVIPSQFERLVAFANAQRAKVRGVLGSIQKRRLFWQEIIEGGVGEAVLAGNEEQAAAELEAALAAVGGTRAALYLVGAGAGDPELITVKAIRLLSRADVVLYDRLVAPQLLDMYARKEAERISVGKQAGNHHKKQEEIGALIRAYLQLGKVVVRLKGGDPSIFAHGAEELAIAKELNVPFQIVPGITAATGCAAMAGFPLTERDGAQAVRFLTLYSELMDKTEFWESLRHGTRDTLVFYMATAHRNLLCEKLQEVGFAGTTPIVAIEQGTTPQHREYAATLADFPERFKDHNFASPTLIVVGEVVRWREEHGWKKPASTREDFFLSVGKVA